MLTARPDPPPDRTRSSRHRSRTISRAMTSPSPLSCGAFPFALSMLGAGASIVCRHAGPVVRNADRKPIALATRGYGNARTGKAVRVVQDVAQELDQVVAFPEKCRAGFDIDRLRQIALPIGVGECEHQVVDDRFDGDRCRHAGRRAGEPRAPEVVLDMTAHDGDAGLDVRVGRRAGRIRSGRNEGERRLERMRKLVGDVAVGLDQATTFVDEAIDQRDHPVELLEAGPAQLPCAPASMAARSSCRRASGDSPRHNSHDVTSRRMASRMVRPSASSRTSAATSSSIARCGALTRMVTGREGLPSSRATLTTRNGVS